jgi:hypothetical protein
MIFRVLLKGNASARDNYRGSCYLFSRLSRWVNKIITSGQPDTADNGSVLDAETQYFCATKHETLKSSIMSQHRGHTSRFIYYKMPRCTTHHPQKGCPVHEQRWEPGKCACRLPVHLHRRTWSYPIYINVYGYIRIPSVPGALRRYPPWAHL